MRLAPAGPALSSLRDLAYPAPYRTALLPWRKISLVCTCTGAVSLPLLQPSGPGNASFVDVFICLSIFTTLLWAAQERLVIRMPYVVPIAVMAFAGAIASIFSVFPGDGFISVVQDFVLLAWSTTIVTVCRRGGALGAVMRAWAYSSVVWAILMVGGALLNIDPLAGITAREGNRASLTFGDPNMAAGYFVSSLMMVWASRTPRHRVLRWASCLMLVIAVVFTGSNGFSLCTVAATAVAGAIGVARNRGILSSIVTYSTVILCVGIVATQVDVNTIVNDAAGSVPLLRDYIGRSTQSAAGRDSLLHETLGLVSEGGIIGIGPGSVKPTLKATQAEVAFEAHSDYSASIAERGLLGGIGFLLLLLAIAFRARWSQAPLSQDFAAAVRRQGPLIGGLVAYAIAANIYELLHFRYVWTFLAIVAAVSMWGPERRFA